MSSISVSNYVFFLKSCHFGQELLEKYYKTMQEFHRAWFLGASEEKVSYLKGLQSLSFLIEEAVSSMAPCCHTLEEQLVVQEAHSQSSEISVWDYSLVLNEQYNLHTFFKKRDLEIKKALKLIEHAYGFQAWIQGVFFAEKVKQLQAGAQFMNERMLYALKETQGFLDKIPPKAQAQNRGTFDLLMQHLKEYKAFDLGGDSLLKKILKDDDTAPYLSQGDE